MKFRYVHVSFWQDAEILDMTPEEKFFFLYLLTNSHTSQSGIYELSTKLAAVETGYNTETIEKLINKFIEKGKINYDPETKEIYIRNWLKYNWSDSAASIKAIVKSLDEVKSVKLLLEFWNNLSEEQQKKIIESGFNPDTIQGLYIGSPETQEAPYREPIGGLQTPYRDPAINKKKKKKEKENNNILTTPNGVVVDTEVSTSSTAQVKTPYQEIVDLYHKLCPSLPRVKVLTETRKRYIRARWREHPQLEFWEQFFMRVEASDFLTGRADYGNRKPFLADLEWLVRPNNFAKVLEGRYDNRQKKEQILDDDILDELAKSWEKKWG